jgi:hypothetical protein
MEWINAQEKLPEKEGRYLILRTFAQPCTSLDSIVREHIPFVSTFRFGKGWTSALEDDVITHWMEIPPL